MAGIPKARPVYHSARRAPNLRADADLDPRHGLVSTITWNGEPVDMFHYDVTLTYPSTVGCYMGTPTRTATGHPRAS